MSALRQWLLAVLLAWASVSAAEAHLVVSQHGTLNIVGDGAYMVLSLPVSALTGFDDNHDSLLSVGELRAHTASIESQIKRGVTLGSSLGPSKLEGVMLNTEAPDSDPSAPSTHLVVLGRFAVPAQATELTFALHLFGTGADEQTEHIAVTRGDESQLITLTPEQPQGSVLPSAWATFSTQVRLGALHVISGVDHLLFLLVVLAAAWNLRQVLLALTCFTAGHAITLMACVWYGLTVPSSLVEPAIAATIVGMAVFDRWSAYRRSTHPLRIRLNLIFACALIHGLGLASAFNDLGLNGIGRVLSLAGFNTGIEIGQVAIALIAALVMHGIRQVSGLAGLVKATRLASYGSMALGSLWFLQRAMG